MSQVPTGSTSLVPCSSRDMPVALYCPPVADTQNEPRAQCTDENEFGGQKGEGSWLRVGR